MKFVCLALGLATGFCVILVLFEKKLVVCLCACCLGTFLLEKNNELNLALFFILSPLLLGPLDPLIPTAPPNNGGAPGNDITGTLVLI